MKLLLSLYHSHECKGEGGHEQGDLCSGQKSRLVSQLPGQSAEVREQVSLGDR